MSELHDLLLAERQQNIALRATLATLARETTVLRQALKPFAAYADHANRFPATFVITAGSPFAKLQLTMGDCYKARAALAL